ncbi:polysaccharide biosynthesis/export family protein [Polaribacter vadi]|uniref:polysaccharide biosynthesis/export family protein n=1 Tax=Polaribacter TaxID=52959 RepID=UPI001C0926FE|nr:MULTISPECIES: polysaccharide biosynthesis/export family protein [Polaribacter]MBU3010514.1 polysaccharide biosynthesis/export family protein [Polaribacter vadi]MDO6740322.1 polysaccharide biosynthesis/export family protein [Polaribacter sp. 1_MG-2023]
MKLFSYKKIFYFLIFFTTVLSITSCATKKSVLYFQDAENINLRKLNYSNSKIQTDDIINIKVTALNEESVAPYNIENGLSPSTSFIEILKLQGYLVSKEGDIVFPIIGKINVVDKTTSELENYIKTILIDGNHVIDPTVSVRLLNSKFTILGEVNKAGTYTITENNITLLQAIGYAGDLTINGSRKDVLIIRSIDGLQKTKKIDLTKTDWFNSEFYFIKQNDVIVINPNSNKIKSSGFLGSAGALMSAISLVLTSILIVIN